MTDDIDPIEIRIENPVTRKNVRYLHAETVDARIVELQNGLRNIYEMLPTKRENDQDIIDEIKRLLKPKENER